MWIPITAIYLLLSFANRFVIISALVLVLLCMFWEQYVILQKKHYVLSLLIFSWIPCALGFFALIFFMLFEKHFTEIFLVLGMASSLADVGAFFLGKFCGFHHLAPWINAQKTWEGIIGEFLGAFFMIILLQHFVFPSLSLFYWIPIGMGSTTGDILNSYTKRRVGIVSWGNFLPGHGGLTDRFISLSGSTFFVFLFFHFATTMPLF